jgi:hypothetical protein
MLAVLVSANTGIESSTAFVPSREPELTIGSATVRRRRPPPGGRSVGEQESPLLAASRREESRIRK